MIVVLATGAFDLLHVGHVRFLQQARDQGDVLVVGVVTESRRHPNKAVPAISFEQRYEMVAALRCVNGAVVPFSGPEDLYDAVDHYGVNIRVISSLYPAFADRGHEEVRKKLEQKGVRYVVVPHTPEVSSTRIRERIKEIAREEDTAAHNGTGTAGVSGERSVTGEGLHRT